MKGWVGTLKPNIDLETVTKEVNNFGHKKINICLLSGNMVMIRSEDEMAIKDFMEEDKEILNKWFENIKPWKPEFVPLRRHCWVQCYGAPIHAFNTNLFRAIVNTCGYLIKVDERTRRKEILHCGRFRIETSRRDPILLNVSANIDGKIFQIKVIEELVDPQMTNKDQISNHRSDQSHDDVSSPKSEYSGGGDSTDFELERSADVNRFGGINFESGSEKNIVNWASCPKQKTAGVVNRRRCGLSEDEEEVVPNSIEICASTLGRRILLTFQQRNITKLYIQQSGPLTHSTSPKFIDPFNPNQLQTLNSDPKTPNPIQQHTNQLQPNTQSISPNPISHNHQPDNLINPSPLPNNTQINQSIDTPTCTSLTSPISTQIGIPALTHPSKKRRNLIKQISGKNAAFGPCIRKKRAKKSRTSRKEMKELARQQKEKWSRFVEGMESDKSEDGKEPSFESKTSATSGGGNTTVNSWQQSTTNSDIFRMNQLLKLEDLRKEVLVKLVLVCALDQIF